MRMRKRWMIRFKSVPSSPNTPIFKPTSLTHEPSPPGTATSFKVSNIDLTTQESPTVLIVPPTTLYHLQERTNIIPPAH